MRKSLKDISLNITEEEYRQMPELSYSTLAKYERGGFSSIKTLFDKVESPSLLFGSCVDTYLTDGVDAFNDRFMVAIFPELKDSEISVIKSIFNITNGLYTWDKVTNDTILQAIDECKFQPNWRPETRLKVIKEKGEEYYNLMVVAKDKTLISQEMYDEVLAAVDALKSSESTKWFFADNNPFEDVERLYQLKFNAELDGIGYRCMFDELIVDYTNKTIQPIDLKTSYKNEYDFYKSFVEWSYQIQNRLYVRILQENIKKDPFFKDFKILPYKDVVVCKTSLNPLVWDCDFTFAVGNLKFGKNQQIEMRDPEVIGKELHYYLENNSIVPKEIDVCGSNDLRTWINRM